MKPRITVAVLLLSILASLAGCVQMIEPGPVDGVDFYGDYYKDHYRRPVEIRGVIAVMPSENYGPICGTVGVDYCRIMVALTSVPFETDIATVRWEFDGTPMPEWDDMTSFPWNFQSTGEHHIRVEIVDEFDREVVFDGPFCVVSPRSDYTNPWYTY